MAKLIFLFLCFFQYKLWACLDSAQPIEAGASVESDILFFKTDENAVIRQHLTYHQGRAYFNFSECRKGDSEAGFRLSEATQFDFERDCFLLGPWVPVYDSLGGDTLQTSFQPQFEEHLNEYLRDLQGRSHTAPYVKALLAQLNDFSTVLSLTAGAVVIHQAYRLAPFANTFGGPRGGKANLRSLRFGGFLVFYSAAVLLGQGISRETQVELHQEKIQAVVDSLARLEREAPFLRDQAHTDQDYPLDYRVYNEIVKALSATLYSYSGPQAWVCEPVGTDWDLKT